MWVGSRRVAPPTTTASTCRTGSCCTPGGGCRHRSACRSGRSGPRDQLAPKFRRWLRPGRSGANPPSLPKRPAQSATTCRLNDASQRLLAEPSGCAGWPLPGGRGHRRARSAAPRPAAPAVAVSQGTSVAGGGVSTSYLETPAVGTSKAPKPAESLHWTRDGPAISSGARFSRRRWHMPDGWFWRFSTSSCPERFEPATSCDRLSRRLRSRRRH